MKDLKIVYGRNGSDLRSRMRAKAAEFAARTADDEKAFFIVPDQYTLTAERFLLSELGEKSLHKIRVVSFKRLASLAFSEQGKTFDFVGEGGRSALVLSAFNAVSPQLKYYAGYSDFYFNDALCERIKMFREYAVTPDALLAAETSDAVHDLALIYGAYDALLGTDRADPADNLRLFSELISERGLFRGTTVFVDFFKVLNASELSVVRALYENGADVSVSLVLDESIDDCGLFAPVLAVQNKIRRFVERCGGKIVFEKAETGTEYKAKGLANLENLLSAETLPDKNSFSESESDGVKIYKATDLSDEVDFVCCRICELVLDHGYRFSDIAVVTRDDERYAPYFEKVFADYSIPFFRHKKSGLLEKKAVRFLSALFDAVRFGYRTAEVLEVVSCGYLDGISATAAAEFECYVRIWNVSGKAFFEPFTRSVRGFSGNENPTDSDAKRLAEAENVRLRVCELLSFLGKGTEKASVRFYAERLFSLFGKLGLEQRIASDTDNLAAMGETVLATESEKLFELLVRGLDEYVRISADEEVSLDLFGRMYLRIISEYSVGSIPTALESVIVGGADTAPLLGKRAVFVLGLREGSFPKTPAPSTLISEKERASLEEQGITVDLSPFDKFLYEQFIAYHALTSATELVYMSFPASDGGESVPCEIFDRCLSAFPTSEIKALSDGENGGTLSAASADRLYRARPSKIKAVEYCIRDLVDYFGITPADETAFAKAFYEIPEGVAKKLYGTPIYVSATKSDTFASCPYRYFVRFGLGIDELQKAEFSAVNVGSLMHASLDRIFKKQKDISALDDGALATVASDEVEKYMKEAFGADADRRDMKACADSVRKRLLVLLRSMRNELSTSGYRPVYTELGIGRDDGGLPPYDLDCGNGTKARITGSIDRVDAFDYGGKTFVRVIDYKTGKKEFSLTDICRGKKLQLPLYLDVLTETGSGLFASEPQPFGMMYYVLDAEIKSDKDADSLAFNEFAEKGVLPSSPDEHKKSGMILDDEEHIVSANLDRDYREVGKKQKCFVKAEPRDFDTVFSYVKDEIRYMCGTLSSGKMKKTPFKSESCAYCPIADICENSERPLDALKLKDPLKYMREKDERDGENDG